MEKFYIGSDGQFGGSDVTLEAVLHAMPGIGNPYTNNVPQLVQEHFINKPFFTNFPFGYVAANVDWFEAAGIPYASFDYFGLENAYPLVRVQAKNTGGTVLSTVDTVLPISGEASCVTCHSTNTDYTSVHGVANRTDIPTTTLSTPLAGGDQPELPGQQHAAQVSLEYAADINLLRLHYLKHGSHYVSTACDTGGRTASARGRSLHHQQWHPERDAELPDQQGAGAGQARGLSGLPLHPGARPGAARPTGRRYRHDRQRA